MLLQQDADFSKGNPSGPGPPGGDVGRTLSTSSVRSLDGSPGTGGGGTISNATGIVPSGGTKANDRLIGGSGTGYNNTATGGGTGANPSSDGVTAQPTAAQQLNEWTIKNENLRTRLMAVMDGKAVQTTMTFLTVFALYGDDLRMKFFFLHHDVGFYVLYTVTFFLFSAELVVFSVCKENYKYSFFFWLDMVASLSILPDIVWVMDFIQSLFDEAGGASTGQTGVARAGRASRAGTRAGRIVRLIRLVRLLRVVNIAKFFSKEEKSELDNQGGVPRQNSVMNGGTSRGANILSPDATLSRRSLNNALAPVPAEQDGVHKTASSAQNHKRVEASRLGKILSEQTTRTVILGVLCMMLVLPMIELEELNGTPAFGLEQIFWMSRSMCSTYNAFVAAGLKTDTELTCAGSTSPSTGIAASNSSTNSTHAWISDEGFQYLLFAYTEQSRFLADGELTDTVSRPILYMAVPNTLGGAIRPLEYVTTKRCDVGTRREYPFLGWDDDFAAAGGKRPECQQAEAEGRCCWQRHPYCSDVEDSRCPWRESEMEDVAFSPSETCPDSASEKPISLSSSCTHLTVYAKILNRSKTETQAEYSMIQTTFIVFLLGVGAMMFSKDTQTLVIAPIEKMVNIVKQLADDPLSKPSADVLDPEANEKLDQNKASSHKLETNMLETTILKIGGLLQVGFGEAGAQIIGKNMSSQDGELNILIPGRKIFAIFGFCFIRDFMETTECLLEEVMVFVNKIARIVHICVHEWGGAANKNIGDSFLLTWIVNDVEEQDLMLKYGYEDNHQMQDLADKALVAFVKVIAELRRASDLRAYSAHPKIQQRFLNSYEIKMGFGLHCGWAIEGAIGSEHKIDASYLSPHVNMCARLETATEQYHVDMLFSESFHALLSAKAADRCRKVDVVIVKGSAEPCGIYTLDLNVDACVLAPDGHQPGEVITSGEISKESLITKGVPNLMFEMDQDLIRMQEGITAEFHSAWKQAFHLYINGAWNPAKEALLRVSQMRMQAQQVLDGPSECLLNYLATLDFTPPEDWAGCRKLESK